MDEDLWLEDGLEELFLGVPGAPAPAAPEAHRGAGRKWATWKPEEEDEDERIFREMVEATLVPKMELMAFEGGRKRQLDALSISRQMRHIESQLNPSPEPMSPADKKKLEERKILHKIESAERLRQEKEKYARQMAMNAKMAKVRAAKRKTGKR